MEFAVESLIIQGLIISEKTDGEERIYTYAHHCAEKNMLPKKMRDVAGVCFEEDDASLFKTD
ncbi:MAG: hypothetical protein L6V93_22465 [Clostridiales bacterium]|nr:MAG: hypothetical protein L6V93_22465 [Clostridiales bacterium]